MAVYVFTNAHVTINSVDLSAYVKRVALNVSLETQDISAMGSDWRARLPGVKEWNMEVELNHDFAASQVDATLWTVFAAGAAVPIIVRPTAGVVGAGNPEYTGSGILREYPVLANAHGEPGSTSISIDGTGALARAVA